MIFGRNIRWAEIRGKFWKLHWWKPWRSGGHQSQNPFSTKLRPVLWNMVCMFSSTPSVQVYYIWYALCGRNVSKLQLPTRLFSKILITHHRIQKARTPTSWPPDFRPSLWQKWRLFVSAWAHASKKPLASGTQKRSSRAVVSTPRVLEEKPRWVTTCPQIIWCLNIYIFVNIICVFNFYVHTCMYQRNFCDFNQHMMCVGCWWKENPHLMQICCWEQLAEHLRLGANCTDTV